MTASTRRSLAEVVLSKVVRFYETGGPDVLRIEDVDVGEPGPNEVRVKIEAIGLNRAELGFRACRYLESPRLPARIGYEASGIIESLGAGVVDFVVGEPVSIIPAFSMNDYGVYAERAVVPAYALLKRPTGLDATTAAAVWMSYPTAWGALCDIARITFGDVVVITAASSSVGLSAIQIANSVGAIAVAVTRTRDKLEALEAAGAAHVVVSDEQDLVEEVMRITGGAGARIVFDPIGGPVLEQLAALAAPLGIIFQYGALSGAPTPFPLLTVAGKGITIRGYTLFEFIRNPVALARCATFVQSGLARGYFAPVISKVFDLSEIVAAHAYMELSQHVGKIVVTVNH